MIRVRHIAVLAAAFLCIPSAMARDTHHDFPLSDAMASADARDKLDPGIKFYFGTQKHPKVIKRFGEWGTNKKTNAFGKDDKVACEWVFLSAMLELQERAQKEGGNAVINIKSNYRGKETVSNDTYQCGAGAIMAGVALKGTVVRIAD